MDQYIKEIITTDIKSVIRAIEAAQRDCTTVYWQDFAFSVVADDELPLGDSPSGTMGGGKSFNISIVRAPKRYSASRFIVRMQIESDSVLHVATFKQNERGKTLEWEYGEPYLLPFTQRIDLCGSKPIFPCQLQECLDQNGPKSLAVIALSRILAESQCSLSTPLLM